MSRQGKADAGNKRCIFRLGGGAPWQVGIRSVFKPIKELVNLLVLSLSPSIPQQLDLKPVIVFIALTCLSGVLLHF